MSEYRTHTGAVLTDERTGQRREVVEVYRPEDLPRFVDERCYLRKPLGERSALHGGGRRRGPAMARS